MGVGGTTAHTYRCFLVCFDVFRERVNMRILSNPGFMLFGHNGIVEVLTIIYYHNGIPYL